jgi:hypothetical protein
MGRGSVLQANGRRSEEDGKRRFHRRSSSSKAWAPRTARQAVIVSDTLGEVSDDLPPEPELDILYVAPERFRERPQRGLSCRMTFSALARYLSHPTLAERKDAAGAWSPALYRGDIRRKDAIIHVSALVVDIDEGGEMGAVAEALARHRAIVHSTFSSTRAAPRCRAVLALANPIDAAMYGRVHAIVRAHLGGRGFVADENAKDASRLSYAPCVRPGSFFELRETDGAPIDAAAVLACHAHEPERVARAKPINDRYSRAAVARAVAIVASMSEGARHATLYREAFSLSRLPVDGMAIACALLPAAIHAGLPKREAVRTISDAVAKRRGST